MAQRADLHAVLQSIMGANKVYFQPPSEDKMEYPCIRYELDDVLTLHADNKPYRQDKRYQVTIIDRDPDSPYPDQVGALPKSRFDRFYKADGLNHFVYQLFH